MPERGDAGLGTMVRPDGDRIDFARLRSERRRRLLDAMATAGLDALVLGRPADVAYASGARQLWTAGSRPFGPSCVVVAATGRVHLLSTWDEGVPADIGHDELYGLSWNPERLSAAVAGIPGLGDARRVGTDSLAPGFAAFFAGVAPHADVVDGTAAIRAARAVKTPDEVACIATATAIAEAGLAAMVDALRPGVTERELLAVHLERLAELGAPTPPTEAVAWATPRRGAVRPRSVSTDRPVAAGELVVLDAGARFAGYEGGVGRTWSAGTDAGRGPRAELAERCAVASAAVVAACRPGATGADLCAAWRSTGEPLPGIPLAYGLGLGMERPVVGDGLGADEVLVAGSVLAVTSWVTAEGVGGHLERDVVVVGEGGTEMVSRYGRAGR